jgi:biopolymer transport protein ExbD
MNKPNINVTPLIDVLLVLLIIFMVVSPLKPAAFKAKVPAESKTLGDAHPESLVVLIGPDGSLGLNGERGLGTVADTAKLRERLASVFAARAANLVFKEHGLDDPNFPSPDNIERTVFIKAPRSLGYGSVANVIDAAKAAGAVPIGLQIDDLE